MGNLDRAQPALTLRFSDEKIRASLHRTAKRLGMSDEELAEAAIARELAILDTDLPRKLTDTLDALRSYRGEDVERDIEEFARGEATLEDPMQARMAGVEDAYGIGAAFAHRLERG